MKNIRLHTNRVLHTVLKNTATHRRYALFAVAYICLLLGFSGFFQQTGRASSAVLPQQTAQESAQPEETPSVQKSLDARLRLLAKKPDYTAFLLGSFPAYSYNAAVLETYLPVKAYNLTAENLSETEKMFDFAVENSNPSLFFFSIAACDFFPENTVKSAFAVQNLADGSVFRGINDIMRIGDAAEYENKYHYRFAAKKPSEETPSSERVLALYEKMRRICEQKKIRLVTVLSPVYAPEMTESLAACYGTVRQTIGMNADFYDYSQLPLCSDKRFFYNKNEFRACLGNRVLAAVFDSTKSGFSLTDAAKEQTLPILLYHHVTEEPGYGDSVISASRLEEHLRALTAAGYTAVSLSMAEAFVHDGTPLPEKPICITFDDGYESNATLALPLLEKYKMKATFFYIGWAVGKDTYKSTGKPIYQHFDFDTARKMRDTGLIEFGSHTFDMHQSDTLEAQKDGSRLAVQPLKYELPSTFIRAVKDDCRRFGTEFEKQFGEPVRFFSYPHGIYSPLSEKILAGEGFTVTLSTEYTGKNVLVTGLPQSLRALYRFTIGEEMTGDDLLTLIDTVYAP